MRQIIDAVLMTSACLIAAGCSGSPSSPFASVPGPASTVYVGTLTDSINGSGTLTVSLTSGGGLAGGTWAMSFGGSTETRVISGAVNGNAYTAMIAQCAETDTESCVPDCQIAFAGSLTSSSLSGTYSSLPTSQACPVRSGSVNATKQ